MWPPTEAAQIDYESLRAAVLSGLVSATGAAAVFGRAGLAGLIARPAPKVAFVGHLHPGRRPSWHPYADPRLDLLADAIELVLAAPAARVEEAVR